MQSDCFFGRRDDSWKPSDAESFRRRQTIVFKGWLKETPFKSALGNDQYRKSFEHFAIDAHYYKRVANMIREGRADAFWMDINVFSHIKNTTKIFDSSFKNLVYIASKTLSSADAPKVKTVSTPVE